jgi:hypothetical protein
MNRSLSKSTEALLVDCFYYKAIVMRILKRQQEAIKYYEIVRRYVLYEERRQIIVSCFGFLLVPLCNDRRNILNFVEDFLKQLKMHKRRYELIFDPIYETFYRP